MATGIGIGGKFAFAFESTAGTEVSRSLAMRVKSCTLQTKATNTVVEDLSAYANGPTETVQTANDVAGTLEGNASYDKNMLGMILKWVLGSVAESGAGPYVHTFSPGSLPSATGEFLRGANDLSTEEFYGLYAKALTLTLEAGKLAALSLETVGFTSGTRGTQTLPTLSNGGTYINGSHVPGIVFAGTTYACRKITLRINNGLEALRDLGSLSVTEVVRAARLEVTVECELTKRSMALYTAMRANTTGTLAFTATSGANVLAFSSPVAFIEDQADPVDGPGVTIERVRFRCLADAAGTTAICSVALTNGDSTYDAS